jgi:hypothetical protein
VPISNVGHQPDTRVFDESDGMCRDNVLLEALDACVSAAWPRGPKWLRRIILDGWQQSLVNDHPFDFLRGLIHSDGSRVLNRARRTWASKDVRYAYPRYFFTNASLDIRTMFSDTCDIVGVRWTQTNARNIAVSRRRDVELLDRYIGPKS